MGVPPMPFKCAKGMFYNCLPSFVIPWVLFDIIIVYVNGILILAAVNDAFGKFGALIF